MTDRNTAREILASLKIEIGADFHALNSTQVQGLIAAAKAAKYRAPKGANGSRARYFHAMLQRKGA